MPRSIRSASVVYHPFGGDASDVIEILKRQPLPNNESTHVLLRNWSAFCQKADLSQNMPKPETMGQRKRILIIAVAGYTNGLQVLEGSQTDWKIWAILATMAGWRVDILADTVLRADPTRYPTKDNIRSFARALLRENCSGDQFIVAYSGHCDEQGLILADDSQVSSQELHDWFAKPLATGTQLWTFFDCCKSSNLLNLSQRIFFDENMGTRCQPFSRSTQSTSKNIDVKGTVISIGSAVNEAGELGLGYDKDSNPVRCGSLAFTAYLFFHSVCKTGEPLLERFVPYLVQVMSSKEGQEARFTASINVQAPLLPMLRALPAP